ncbi:16S rRNA (uracil(1498)-N(3))-methyltransferase [Virgibacillus alimentarius]|uniref:Ribosomal RNA small subunit methyltransferase E n=1 Tax=Virgibacillus alimentarius TaxID=698769 RepID=A0ABS4S507_9BACI|nr:MULTISPECIES: 16S rRNA (uracil(1498)-N(3))-methyltransferase [Virgibacillus]MBP2256553.1 16S rRNA (uracil1498-N3)-methyltransferase [Virgibacillus alimentarius]HLR66499.1 16S rRNA (uracil(1498)-N(3))-methyltransferase [Virgibacillus sp.]
MQRYFVPRDNWENDQVYIHGDDAHHISKVMRFKINDKVICNHPNGQAAICTITSFDTNLIKLAVIEWLNEQVELPFQITIAQGLPKGDKLDFILQKGTELGAHSFIPFQAQRSIVKWDKKKTEKKLNRFDKIVKEASEQSHRNKIPIIQDIMAISDLVHESRNYDVKLFAYEEEAKVDHEHSFGTLVSNLKEGQRVLVCIGPEGGFSTNEVDLLKKNNFTAVRLGPRILRTETAALYVLASISYHFEELRC